MIWASKYSPSHVSCYVASRSFLALSASQVQISAIAFVTTLFNGFVNSFHQSGVAAPLANVEATDVRLLLILRLLLKRAGI